MGRSLQICLSQIKAKFSEVNIVEIIVDNISFVNDYITLSMDLKPIRDASADRHFVDGH